MKKKSKDKVLISPPGSSFDLPSANVDYAKILKTRGVLPCVTNSQKVPTGKYNLDGTPKNNGFENIRGV